MYFIDSVLQQALVQWRASSDTKERSTADNFWFEVRLSDPRQIAFEGRAAGASDPATLRERQADYWEEFVRVDEDIAHTFDATLSPADLGPIDETQKIVRVEDLFRPLSKMSSPMSFDRLKEAVGNNETDLIDRFLATWNESIVRDWRPCFAAFKDELLDDLAEPDWPSRLRDRMGLAHHDCAAGPVTIALMEYTVGEVIAAAEASGGGSAIVVPTVLDSRPWPYFFPAPLNLTAGRAMALFEVADDNHLLAEVLHFRMTYKREHISRLAEITAPPPANDLKSLRNHHLIAVQMASGSYDFGEEIP